MEEKGFGVSEFLKGEVVLITGGTGFLGKATLEKLLRCCRPRSIFLLVRPKKGATPLQRVNQLFQDPVFDRLRKETGELGKGVVGVEGDVSEEGLGLGEEWRERLLEETTLVLHGAATVNFDETLTLAASINTRGTLNLLKLCTQMKNLKSVVHVSTAYSFCCYDRLEEKFYEPPIEPEALLTLVDSFPEQQLKAITPRLLGKWPNTYTYTKAVAERLVQQYSPQLPLAMFRPAIVIGAKEEPVAGWVDNLYGPTGVLAGAGAGIMRTLYADSESIADMIPVDMAVNALLTIAYETALHREESGTKIYNFVTSNQNPVTWGEFMEVTRKHGRDNPTERAVYYYTFTLTANWALFIVYTLLFHTLPAFFIDSYMALTGKKFRLMKIYKKIAKFSSAIGVFSCRSWKFESGNTLQLLSNMGPEDRKMFNFDVTEIDWDEFFKNNIKAIRKYILKEEEENLDSARRRFFWLEVLHRVVQMSTGCLLLYGCWWACKLTLSLLLAIKPRY